MHTRTQEKGAVTLQETEPKLSVSVQESPAEAWATRNKSRQKAYSKAPHGQASSGGRRPLSASERTSRFRAQGPARGHGHGEGSVHCSQSGPTAPPPALPPAAGPRRSPFHILLSHPCLRLPRPLSHVPAPLQGALPNVEPPTISSGYTIFTSF